MLALVKAEAGPGLRLETVPEPEIGINDVLIRVRKTGICGTDLHIESWDPWAAKSIAPPLIAGHEFVGEVVEVGWKTKELMGLEHPEGVVLWTVGAYRESWIDNPLDYPSWWLKAAEFR